MPDVTATQLACLGALVRLTLAFSGPPSVRRLGQELGKGIHAVHLSLSKLEAAGLAGRALDPYGKVRWRATPAGTAAALLGATDSCSCPTPRPDCNDPGALVPCDGATA